MNKYLDINPEVFEALQANAPVVALESTIISHGMPFPANVQTALAVEEVVRKNGAIPATIGILDGRIVVGLTAKQVEAFGQARDVAKVSRRDLPIIVASRRNGATTVAATMICSAMAGIRLFVTGGIGGVHRDGEITMDVSADLLELAHTNVAVVCAGAKAILDIGRSLEVLETHGVPVLGFETDEFPAFYTRTSGFGVDQRFDTEKEIAAVLKTKWELGLNGGAVIAVPVPQSEALEESVMNEAIRLALLEAKECGISGKNVTPFLLSKVSELTGGNSLRTNIALIKNNAAVGARIAVAMSR